MKRSTLGRVIAVLGVVAAGVLGLQAHGPTSLSDGVDGDAGRATSAMSGSIARADLDASRTLE